LPNGTNDENRIAYRASLIIPLTITSVCTVLDLVSKSRIAKLDVLHIKYICDVVISYFFPSILATSLGMMWTYYFGTGISGIKEGYGIRFSGLTGLLFLSYIIGLFFADKTAISVFFLILLCIYLTVVFRSCMDQTLLQGVGLQDVVSDINRVSNGGMQDE